MSQKRILSRSMTALVLLAATTALPAGRSACAGEAPGSVSLCILDAKALAPAADVDTLQLADDIVHRLRRMGVFIIKTRLAHPYEPYDDIC